MVSYTTLRTLCNSKRFVVVRPDGRTMLFVVATLPGTLPRVPWRAVPFRSAPWGENGERVAGPSWVGPVIAFVARLRDVQ